MQSRHDFGAIFDERGDEGDESNNSSSFNHIGDIDTCLYAGYKENTEICFEVRDA